MTASTSRHAQRLPLRYLPAAYLESAPKLVGSLILGAIYLFVPDVWPGAWAWITLGPLIAVLICEPVWRWTFTRVTITQKHLRVTTGAIYRREQTLAWVDVGAIDSRQSWAFARWRLHVITLSQAGDKRTKVHLWAADESLHQDVTALAGHARDDTGAAPVAVADAEAEAEAEATGTLLYRVRIRHLLLASVVYGQFAIIGGAAAMGISELLGTLGADKMIARWLPLPPAVWAVSIVGGIIVLGLILTVIRYASFEVRRMPDGRLMISYGLFSTHTRSITPDAVIGVVLQRNIAETLLGRVRLSLLATDSAAQLGTNLVLPSLPRLIVERLLYDEFGEDRATRLLTSDRGFRAFGIGIAALASLAAVTLFAGWAASGQGWPPGVVLAVGALVLAVAWPASRVLCSRTSSRSPASRGTPSSRTYTSSPECRERSARPVSCPTTSTHFQSGSRRASR